MNGNLTEEQVSLIDACFHGHDITDPACQYWKEWKELYADSNNDNT